MQQQQLQAGCHNKQIRLQPLRIHYSIQKLKVNYMKTTTTTEYNSFHELRIKRKEREKKKMMGKWGVYMWSLPTRGIIAANLSTQKPPSMAGSLSPYECIEGILMRSRGLSRSSSVNRTQNIRLRVDHYICIYIFCSRGTLMSSWVRWNRNGVRRMSMRYWIGLRKS